MRFYARVVGVGQPEALKSSSCVSAPQEKEARRDGSSATPDAVHSSVTSWQGNIAQQKPMG